MYLKVFFKYDVPTKSIEIINLLAAYSSSDWLKIKVHLRSKLCLMEDGDINDRLFIKRYVISQGFVRNVVDHKLLT